MKKIELILQVNGKEEYKIEGIKKDNEINWIGETGMRLTKESLEINYIIKRLEETVRVSFPSAKNYEIIKRITDYREVKEEK